MERRIFTEAPSCSDSRCNLQWFLISCFEVICMSITSGTTNQDCVLFVSLHCRNVEHRNCHSVLDYGNVYIGNCVLNTIWWWWWYVITFNFSFYIIGPVSKYNQLPIKKLYGLMYGCSARDGSFYRCSLWKNGQWSSAWLKGRPSAIIFKETLQIKKALIDFRGHGNDMPSWFRTPCSDTPACCGSASTRHKFVEPKYSALAFSLAVLVFCALTSNGSHSLFLSVCVNAGVVEVWTVTVLVTCCSRHLSQPSGHQVRHWKSWEMFVITVDDNMFDFILMFLCDVTVDIGAVMILDFHYMIIVAIKYWYNILL